MEYHTYERGGITYTFAVTAEQGSFCIAWTCPVCESAGSVKLRCESSNEAIGRAQACIFSDHHVPVHVMGRATK
jgi:hypothetical protein